MLLRSEIISRLYQMLSHPEIACITALQDAIALGDRITALRNAFTLGDRITDQRDDITLGDHIKALRDAFTPGDRFKTLLDAITLGDRIMTLPDAFTPARSRQIGFSLVSCASQNKLDCSQLLAALVASTTA